MQGLSPLDMALGASLTAKEEAAPRFRDLHGHVPASGAEPILCTVRGNTEPRAGRELIRSTLSTH